MSGAPVEDAPFLADIADGPPNGRAWWLQTADGTRARLGLWPLDGATGTVVILPGRTEYIEKYGPVAEKLHAGGWSVAAIDWRGQGLADRPAHRWDMGHVEAFSDYQLDLDAALSVLAGQADAPQPWFMIGHSMGGAIGLRALQRGLAFEGAVFSAPMWGIAMSRIDRAYAGLLRLLAGPLGVERRFVPSTGPSKPLAFEGNRLTSDRAQFDWAEAQIAAHPKLALGGPSIRWLTQARTEIAKLVAMPPPPLPALTFLGSEEKIIDTNAVRRRMANWPNGRLHIIDGAEHELMIEAPHRRDAMVEMIIDWFKGAAR